MFLRQVGKPTKLKKILYTIFSIVLGLLLSFNLHALIEINYLHWATERGWTVVFYGGCALPLFLRIIIWLLGIISGYLFGRFFWRKIYIERKFQSISKKV